MSLRVVPRSTLPTPGTLMAARARLLLLVGYLYTFTFTRGSSRFLSANRLRTGLLSCVRISTESALSLRHESVRELFFEDEIVPICHTENWEYVHPEEN